MTGAGEGYAQALYGLAKDESVTLDVMQQLDALKEVFLQEPEFLKLLSTPNISKAERCRIVDDTIGDQVHLYVRNMLKLMTEEGCVRKFSDCVEQYRRIYNEDNGIVSVLATTAMELSDTQKNKLQEKLEAVIGKKVQLQIRVEPACVGGICLDYDGRRIDATVKTRLNLMRKQLLESR